MYKKMKVVYDNEKSFILEIAAADEDEFYYQLLKAFKDAEAHYNPDEWGQFGIKYVECSA